MLGALGITSIFMLHSESFSVWDSIWVILSTFLHHHRTVSSGNEVFLVFFRCFFTNWDTPKRITLFKLNIPTPSFGSTSGVPSLTKVYLSFWIHPLWRIGHPKNLIPQCNFPSFPARRRPLTFVAFSANSAGANPLCERQKGIRRRECWLGWRRVNRNCFVFAVSVNDCYRLRWIVAHEDIIQTFWVDLRMFSEYVFKLCWSVVNKWCTAEEMFLLDQYRTASFADD